MLQRWFDIRIFAHGADEGHIRAQVSRSHCLVCALAASGDAAARTQQGFTGIGVASNASGEVSVDGSDYS